MYDFILPTIEALFQYVERTPPMVTSGERLLDAEQRVQAARIGAARTRWLDEHGAERSFACGVVRWEAPTDEGTVIVEVFVTAVVTDTAVVFLVDRPDGSGGVPIEVGSIDRRALTEVEVLRPDGRAVPRPAAEPMDPEPEVLLVIKWRDAAGATASQRLLFGSSWEAWKAVDRLRAAMPSADRSPSEARSDAIVRRVPTAIRQATPEDWSVVRAVRLRALADAPRAFASRLDDERDRPASVWRERLTSPRAATFLAFDDDDAVGIVAVFVVPDDDTRTHLVSMWVAPPHRRTGVARAMIDRVLEWSRAQAAQTVELWVTETNEPARRLYLGCGFVPSGERQPLPSDPSVEEIQLHLLLER